MIWPVIDAAASEARNTTAAATSAGKTGRPMSDEATKLQTAEVSRAACIDGVSTTPRANALHRTPWRPYAVAMCRVRAFRPPVGAEPVVTQQRMHGGRVDDDPAAGGHHVRECGAAGEVRAAQVDRQDPVESGGVGVGDGTVRSHRLRRGQRGVVVQQIEPAPRLDGGVNHRRDTDLG
jgi:hypothetical protein